VNITQVDTSMRRVRFVYTDLVKQTAFIQSLDNQLKHNANADHDHVHASQQQHNNVLHLYAFELSLNILYRMDVILPYYGVYPQTVFAINC
jgi:hypothetical protein